MSTETVVKVVGMSCGHCTAAVEEALTKLPGVEQASADLATGRVSIRQDGSVSAAAIAEAVAEAGFDLVT